MKVGFIGAGNMAQAMLKNWIISNKLSSADIWISDPDAVKRDALVSEYGVTAVADNKTLIRGCNAVILAIKPNISDAVLDDIGASAVGKIILSIVTGLTTDALLRELPGAAVARIMPNTPALVGEGVIAFSRAHTLDEKTFAWASDLFSSLGRVYLVGENDMEAVTGVSGSGPAYAFIMIEAMADAGVRMGLPRALAYELAAQTLVGAGRMVLESERNPAALKDSVCSPGGTTIEAVYALEKGGFRAAVMDAVSVCALKAKALRDAQ